MAENKAAIWLNLMVCLDRINRGIKEPGWYEEDREGTYGLKDRIIQKILRERPDCLEVELRYIPYFMYSNATKDKAGALMRSDTEKLPFDYYLSLIEPSSYDTEIPDRALIEVTITCCEQAFCFHMPVDTISGCGIDINGLPRKKWVHAKDFHRNQYLEAKSEIDRLLMQIIESNTV